MITNILSLTHKYLISFSILSFIVFTFHACNKSESNAINAQEKIIEIELVQPNNSIVERTDLTFEWESNIIFPLKFMLDESDSFEHPILDTLLDSSVNTFSYKEYLAPNSTYYWKISRFPHYELTQFRTEDIISKYSGNYDVTVFKKHRDDYYEELNYDSILNTTLEIAIVDNKINLFAPNAIHNTNLDFESPWPNDSINDLRYSYVGTIDRRYVNMHINTDVDSIFIYRFSGSPSARTSWVIRTQKE